MTQTDACRLLAGKVLFLAGAGPQIGAATALIAAREGARVALVARRTETAEAIATRIVDAGGDAIALECDLTADDDVRAALDATVAELGPVDTVFYNAAYYDNRQADIEIDEAVWGKSMAVNLEGAMRVARLTIPSMVERGRGILCLHLLGGVDRCGRDPIRLSSVESGVERRNSFPSRQIRQARCPRQRGPAICPRGQRRFGRGFTELPRTFRDGRRDR